MTSIEQQRLIGGFLLLCILSAITFFLLSGANNKGGEQTSEIKIQQKISSVIEPISDAVEVLDYGQETLVDPDRLASNDVSPASIVSPKPDIVAQVAPVKNKPVSQPKPVKTPVEATKTKAVMAKPIIKEDKPIIPENSSGWLLQLGVFSVKTNAQAIQKKVAALGYDAKIEQIKTDKGNVYRVRIGPESNKPAIKKIADRLKKELKLNTQILQQTS